MALDGPRGRVALPGAEGRIPNFAGAKAAAERLAKHPAWVEAETIKANPDSPQTHARRLALAQGKTLVMAVPRLRDQHPFRLLDPRKLDEEQLREAATIKGALRHGEVIDVDQVPELDLVLTGSVAVNLKGARWARAAASRTSSTGCSPRRARSTAARWWPPPSTRSRSCARTC